MKLGVNISNPSPWSSNLIYNDALKNATDWVYDPNGGSDGGLVPAGSLSADGWPTLLNTWVACYAFAVAGGTATSPYPTGTGVLIYDGDVELTTHFGLANGTWTEDAAYAIAHPGSHRWTGTIDWHGPSHYKLWLRIRNTNANNLFRNAKLYLPGTEELTSRFHQSFLDRFAGMEILRFMDCFGTNASTWVTWAQRPKTTDFSVALRGMAVEDAIALCNEIGADMYVNVGHQMDDTCIQTLGSTIKTGLDASLNVMLEYGNEIVWNTYQQFGVASAYVEAFPNETGAESYARLFANMVAQFNTGWDSVGDADSATRVTSWVTGQAVNTWYTREFCAKLITNYPACLFSGILSASYMDQSQTAKQRCLDYPATATVANMPADWQDFFVNTFEARLTAYQNLAIEMSTDVNSQVYAGGRTIKHGHYEAGSHAQWDIPAQYKVTIDGVDHWYYYPTAYVAAIIAFHNDATMKPIYKEGYQMMADHGAEFAINYATMGRPTQGYWDPWPISYLYSETDSQRLTALKELQAEWAATTPPDAPTTIVLTVVSSSEIDVEWTDASTDEDGFKIERKVGAAGSWTQIGTVAAGVEIYHDTGLAANTLYYYRVRAYNDGGNSTYATEAFETTEATPVNPPEAPSALASVAVGTDTIDLTWVDNSVNELGISIERKEGSGGTYAQIATTAADAIAYRDTGLSPSTTYYYKIRAYNPGGDSAYTAEVSATTAAAAASLAAGTASGTLTDTTYSISATAPTGGSGAYTYQWYRQGPADADYVLWTDHTALLATELSLERGQTYRYKLLYSDGVLTAYSNVLSVTPTVFLPSEFPPAATGTLAAVNRILAAIKEPPVIALDTGGTSPAGQAEVALDEANVSVQTRGYHENTEENVTLAARDVTKMVMAITGGSWDVSELTLTSAAAFAAYAWEAGDQLYVSGGTGVTAGWYEIEARLSDSAIRLKTAIAAADAADVTTTVIGWHSAITVGTDILVIDTSGADEYRDVCRRANRLFDRDNNTYSFDAGLTVSLIRLIPFASLNPATQAAVVTEAAQVFQRRRIGSTQQDAFLNEEAQKASIRASKTDADNADMNILNTSFAREITGEGNFIPRR